MINSLPEVAATLRFLFFYKKNKKLAHCFTKTNEYIIYELDQKRKTKYT
jgi:hypothetical protein